MLGGVILGTAKRTVVAGRRLVAGGRGNLAGDLARRFDQGADFSGTDAQLGHGSSVLIRETEKLGCAIPAQFASAFGQFAGDDQALDVAGALVDLADADIAVDPLDREIGEV